MLSQVDREGRAQDGLVRLHEVYNLSLNARLVVLSACSTALGRHVDGEGLIGLSRGFLHAGADAVVATLWAVDNRATAAFMTRFYDALLRSATLACGGAAIGTARDDPGSALGETAELGCVRADRRIGGKSPAPGYNRALSDSTWRRTDPAFHGFSPAV